MTIQVRRIVTGYDTAGRSTIQIDQAAPQIPEGAYIWSTDRLPIDNSSVADETNKIDGPLTTTLSSACAVIEFPPGTNYDFHYTNTLDYVYLAAGELVLVMEGGETILRPGDLLVQRGTIHGWRNDKEQVARLIVVLIASQPLASHSDGMLFDNDLSGQNPT